MSLIEFKDLSIQTSSRQLVKDVSFTINKGEIVSLVGESGSGKSLTCLSVMRLLPSMLKVSGNILFETGNNRVDLLTLEKKVLRQLALKEIAYIFQEPMTALNPVQTCEKQLSENLILCGTKKNDLKERLHALLDMAELKDHDRILGAYPFQLSGGQRQRVMIAMALAGDPSLLIADEPTTALDVLIQEEILELLKSICRSKQKSMLFISHDLDAVKQFSDRTAVMFKGSIVEMNDTQSLINHPQHNYTKALLACKPSPEKKGYYLSTLADSGEISLNPKPFENISVSDRNILKVENLNKFYNRKFKAIGDVSFSIKEGESVGLIGESGSGKSTISKILVNLETKTKGTVVFDFKNKNSLTDNVQMIFQDPFAALNPSLKVGTMLSEVFKIHQPGIKSSDIKQEMISLLEKVGLSEGDLEKYPANFSGGQRQRLCIARALAVKPTLLICDEATSALDLSVQAQILNLLKSLQISEHLTILMITHSMSVAAWFCNTLIVLKDGEIVEQGDAERLFANPENAYTKMLFEKSK